MPAIRSQPYLKDSRLDLFRALVTQCFSFYTRYMHNCADGAPPTSFDHSWFCSSQSLESHGKSLFGGACLPTEVNAIPVSFKLGYAYAVIDTVVETALALPLWRVLKYERFLLCQSSSLSPSTRFHLRLSFLHLKLGVVIIIAVVNVVVIRLAVVR